MVNGLSVAPELTISADPGTLEVSDEEAATLRPSSGVAELVIPLPAD